MMSSLVGSPSGISSNSSGPLNSGSEGDLRLLMDQRKRKRMVSNRESARRSRLRKQKHLDDLMAEVARLREKNGQILTGFNAVTQNYLGVEAQNTVLRAQAAELSHRLQSLSQNLGLLCSRNGGFVGEEKPVAYEMAGLVGDYWNCYSQPTVMAAASADALFPY